MAPVVILERLVRHRRAAGLLLAATAIGLTAAAVVIALAMAPGETHLGNDNYETEYLHPLPAVAGSWVALVLVGVTSWVWWPAGLLALAGAFTALWWGVAESNRRLAADGWSDGLEVFGYLLPIMVAGAGLGAVLLGALLAAQARRRRPAR